MGKDWKSEIANWAKLAILSHSEPLWWEKIGKAENVAIILASVGNWPF